MIKQFAELNADNKVIRVINAESKQWCIDNLNGIWIETFNNDIKNPRADIGDTYDSLTNKFIKPVVEIKKEPEV